MRFIIGSRHPNINNNQQQQPTTTTATEREDIQFSVGRPTGFPPPDQNVPK